jgi:hypothetical protein
MSDINNFLGRVLANGVQRTNRYRCTLDVSNQSDRDLGALSIEYPEATILLREGLLCRSTSTPTRDIETTSVNLSAGYEEKYAIGTQYTDFNCIFLCPLINGKNQVLSLFHRWHNLIQNRGENGDMVLSFPDAYRLQQGLTLDLYSSQSEGRENAGPPVEVDPTTFRFKSSVIDQEATTASFQYYDVYPLSVAGTTVDWSSADEMMEVSVSFSFTYWRQVS